MNVESEETATPAPVCLDENKTKWLVFSAASFTTILAAVVAIPEIVPVKDPLKFVEYNILPVGS